MLVGIDTGVKTGISVYDPQAKALIQCRTTGIIKAMDEVRRMIEDGYIVTVYYEDARKRKWIPKGTGRERLQGAGSVKRDASFWQEFCDVYGIKGIPVAPKDNMTKLDAKTFEKVTGWKGKTSTHARDSGMIIFGR